MRRTSPAEDQKFMEQLITDKLNTMAFLEDVLDWIRNNLTPDDVYEKDTLRDWATDNGFIHSKDIPNN